MQIIGTVLHGKIYLLSQLLIYSIIYSYQYGFMDFFFFFFWFFGPYPLHMEVPRLAVKLELQLQAYTTGTATWDPSCVCGLHHSSWQHWIPDPLSKARDQTRILLDTSQIHFHCATMGTPKGGALDGWDLRRLWMNKDKEQRLTWCCKLSESKQDEDPQNKEGKHESAPPCSRPILLNRRLTHAHFKPSLFEPGLNKITVLRVSGKC